MKKIDISELVNIEGAAVLCGITGRRLRQLHKIEMGPPSYLIPMGNNKKKLAFIRSEVIVWNKDRKKKK